MPTVQPGGVVRVKASRGNLLPSSPVAIERAEAWDNRELRAAVSEGYVATVPVVQRQ